MSLFTLCLSAVLYFAATVAQAAGVQFIIVPGNSEGRLLAGAVWTPCAAPTQEVELHRLIAAGVMNCPIVGDRLPLIIISHGRGGWFGSHHDTAESLADAGFVVASINHPGDNALERNREFDASIAITRPSDIKRLVDFMLDTWPDASKIDRQRVGFYGHSGGGYTGLVIAGGTPNLRRAADLCAKGLSPGSPCELFRKNDVPEQRPTHDPRIKAAVIADPGFNFLFGPDDLKDVNVPIQLWSSELGGSGVTVNSVANVNRKLPS